jgi:hypothetical protein
LSCISCDTQTQVEVEQICMFFYSYLYSECIQGSISSTTNHWAQEGVVDNQERDLLLVTRLIFNLNQGRGGYQP